MVTVRKKTPKATGEDLVKSLGRLCDLLEGQKEFDAIKDLKSAGDKLQKFGPGSSEFSAAIGLVIEAFEGEHELQDYTHKGSASSTQWNDAEALFLASVQVYNLAKRLADF